LKYLNVNKIAMRGEDNVTVSNFISAWKIVKFKDCNE